MSKARLIFLLLFSVSILSAQDEKIKLINPSFEGRPHAGGEGANNIKGWQDCGVILFEDETAPDIHLGMPRDSSTEEISFGVRQESSEGFTFLGMVVRDNETYEAVSQRLASPLKPDKCYSFSIDLSFSETFMTPFAPKTADTKHYKKPAVLRVYGGSGACNQRELLAESDPVSNTNWKTFDFEFRPTKTHRYIMLVAYYKVPVLVPYNGNLLVDNASEIVRIPCPGEEIIAEVKPKKDPVKKDPVKAKPKPEDVAEQNPVFTKPPVTQPAKPAPVQPRMVINKELNRATLKKGQTVKIKNLYFDANAIDINLKSTPALEELAVFLNFNKDIQIEIGGHTNTTPLHPFCDSLSTERAKSVAQFLLDAGIPITQLEYKGYGKRKPLTLAKGKAAQARNQRVEIKVLSIGK